MLQSITEFDCYYIGRPCFESTPTLSQLSATVRRAFLENKYFQREENRCLISCGNGVLRIFPLRKDEGFESDTSFEEAQANAFSQADSLSSGAHSGSDSDEPIRIHHDPASCGNGERRWNRLAKEILNISDVIFCHVNNRSIVWVVREKQAKLCGLIFECVAEDATKKLYENFTEERKVLKIEQLRKKRDLTRSESILNRVSIREDNWNESTISLGLLDLKLNKSPIIDKRRQPEPRDIIKKLERKSSFNIVHNTDVNGVMHIEISSGAFSFPDDRHRFTEELNSKFRNVHEQSSVVLKEIEKRKGSSIFNSGWSQESPRHLPKKLHSPVANELEAVLKAQLERRGTPDTGEEERKLSVPENEKPKILLDVRRTKSICRSDRPRSRSRSRPRQRLPVETESIPSLETISPSPTHPPIETHQRHPISRERGRSINRRHKEESRRDLMRTQDPNQFALRGVMPCIVGGMPPGFSGYPPGPIMLYPMPPSQGRYVPYVPSWPVQDPAGSPFSHGRPWEDPGPRHPSEFSEVRNTKDFVEMRRRARSKSPARARQALRVLENAPESRSFGNRLKDALGFKKTKAKNDEISFDTTDGFQPEMLRKSIRKVNPSDNSSCDNKKVTFNAFATVQLMEKR